MSAIMKRCGYVIVTFLVALGLAGVATMTGAAPCHRTDALRGYEQHADACLL